MTNQELLKKLQDLEFWDLVELYLEAKTGKYTEVDDVLSADEVQLIYDLDKAIKEAI